MKKQVWCTVTIIVHGESSSFDQGIKSKVKAKYKCKFWLEFVIQEQNLGIASAVPKKV